jgi:di/tricarboxylate transporter
MTLEIVLIFGILAGAVILFVTNWVRTDVVALLVLVLLVLFGLLPSEDALTGFSSDAVIAIAGLLILSAGLVRSGVVLWIAERLDDLSNESRRRLILLSTTLPGALSGIVSDIATVSLFIPVVLRLARKNDISSKKLLLPIAMAALAGGNLTLIGASHNLVVHSLLQNRGESGFSFFELFPIGAALVAAVTAYSFFFGQRLLPDQKSGEEQSQKELSHDEEADPELIKTYDLHDRLWEIWIQRRSPLASTTVRELNLGNQYGLNLISVVHRKKRQIVNDSEVRIEAGDILLVGGRKERVEEMIEKNEGLKLMGHPRAQEAFPSSGAEFIEVVVPPRSPAVGKTLTELEIRSKTNLSGLAIWKNDQPIRTDVGTTPLEEGDALLLYGSRQDTRDYDPAPEFLWLKPPIRREAPRRLRHLGPYAALVMLAVIVSAAFVWVPISIAALGGSAAMILLGILTPKLAYENVEWRTIVLVGGMYPLGLAIEESGAAELISGLLAGSIGTFGPLAALMGIFLVSLLLTQPLHGAVVAIIMTPVALDTAIQMQVNPKGFAVAVIIGAASTYLMPVGHPAPLLVQQPGNYQSADYLRFGLGLVIITAVITAFFVPIVWPFE